MRPAQPTAERPCFFRTTVLFTLTVPKGDQTRSEILDAAVKRMRVDGLDGVSLGQLATQVGLSKSGLFAHFDSKLELQRQAVRHARDEFIREVIAPALRRPRGLPRVRGLFDLWLEWAGTHESEGGCLFIAGAAEVDDRPGALREELVQTQRDWVATLARAADVCRQEGHFRQDVDPEQFAFDLYAAMMAYHLWARLLGDPKAGRRARAAFESIVAARQPE